MSLSERSQAALLAVLQRLDLAKELCRWNPYHYRRHEYPAVGFNIFIFLLCGFVAYGRGMV